MPALAAVTVLALFFHVTMEWLFFVTKPSFLSALPLAQKLLLPGAAALPLLLAALLPFPLLALAGRGAAAGRAARTCRALGRALPALILACTTLILADNFLRTLLDAGIETADIPVRYLFTLSFLGLLWGFLRLVAGWQAALAASPRARRALAAGAGAVLLLSAGSALLARGETGPGESLPAAAPGAADRPHILLLGSDGVNARHLSLYGYGRRTTPFLERLARESLVCDNAFPNAANTGASVISMLTGRLPTETGVLYPPDILRGREAFRHLPRILRGLGYRTAQISVRHYADAADLNMQDAFDRANGRLTASPAWSLVVRSLGPVGGYFLALMGDRLGSRLVHIFSTREHFDPYREVTGRNPASERDESRLAALFSFLAADAPPAFVHLHLLGTHGPRFRPRERVWSRGLTTIKDWMAEPYDDALLDFDRHLEEVVGFLEKRGLLDRTILVVYSDHGMGFTTRDPVPLLFRFPRGAYAGRLAATAQNLDVAPTLLDALGIEPPAWMEGSSLLRTGLDPCRWVVSTASNSQLHVQKGAWWVSLPRPPFFTLGKISAVTGERSFSLDVTTGQVEESRIDRAGEAPCPVPEPAAARVFLVERLRAAGYDVSSLTGEALASR